MTAARAIALSAVAAFIIAFVTAPAGSSASRTCGPIAQIKDPGLGASFAKFEAQQSPTASKACAFYRNAGL